MNSLNGRIRKLEQQKPADDVAKTALVTGEQREAILKRLADELVAINAGEPMTRKPYEGVKSAERLRIEQRIEHALAKRGGYELPAEVEK